MENQIPLPTDNIYKFYALFGLLLFIFSAGSVLYVTRTTNDSGYQMSLDLAAVKDIPKPTDADLVKKEFLQRRIEVLMQDHNFENWTLGGLMGVAVILMYYGFRTWHKKVQPLQDEILKLQLEKLRHEIKSLKTHKPEHD